MSAKAPQGVATKEPVKAAPAEPVSATALSADARPPGHWLERILVRDQSRVHVIPVERLDYAEAQDDYVCLHTEGQKHLKPMTLSDLERSLDPARFTRIHRSTILNLDRLDKLELYAKDSRAAIRNCASC